MGPTGAIAEPTRGAAEVPQGTLEENTPNVRANPAATKMRTKHNTKRTQTHTHTHIAIRFGFHTVSPQEIHPSHCLLVTVPWHTTPHHTTLHCTTPHHTNKH